MYRPPSINVDASLIQQTHRLTKTDEKVVALQNGCICCTLRGDLLEELVNLAELHSFDYVVIESSGISEPEQVAETFDNRLADQMRLLIEQAEDLEESTIKVLDKMYMPPPLIVLETLTHTHPRLQSLCRRLGEVRQARHRRHRH